jgi:hypothetical protein
MIACNPLFFFAIFLLKLSHFKKGKYTKENIERKIEGWLTLLQIVF